MRQILDYSHEEYHEFQKNHPERVDILMKFLSDCSTESIMNKIYDKDDYILSVSLPKNYWDKDFGCAMFGRVEKDVYGNNRVIVLDSKVF